MRILVVEDDANKYKQIAEHLTSKFVEIEVEQRKSFKSGLKSILNDKYDLVILDMSLPTFDIASNEPGGPFRIFAGEEILGEIYRRSITLDCVVVTQFEGFDSGSDYITLSQLRERLTEKFPNNFVEMIYYTSSESNWKDELEKVISKRMTR